MKDLILITNYSPDSNREQLLRDLVNDVKNENYDIMISTHSFVPKDIFDNVNYVIYDKENLLLTDINSKVGFFYKNDKFTIKSTEIYGFNHAVAGFKLLSLGLVNAKNLGYKKVHHFEYDSRILKTLEIENNSKLIDIHSVVFYLPTNLQFPNSPISFNLDMISEGWFDVSNKKIMSFMEGNNTKMCEQYQQTLIDEIGNYYQKKVSDLESNNILVGINVAPIKHPWVVCVYNKITNKLILFCWTTNEINDIEVKLIVNNSKLSYYIVKPNCWIIRDIDDIDNIENILIIVNNEIRNYLDMSKIDKEYYKLKNQIIE
jgi:hypothetical protein